LLDSGFTGYAQIFEELDTVGVSPVNTYVLGQEVISQTNGTGTNFLLRDGHGSTRLLADASGTIPNRFDFDAYGMMVGGMKLTPNIGQCF
jgi:hypothetical protein